jgi:hypothetical protein
MTTNPQVFQVCMSSEVTDTLDYALSPMDGIVAINTIHTHLSAIHVALTGRTPRTVHDWPKRTQVFWGTFDTLPATFAYIELEGFLHVSGARPSYVDEDIADYKCVLPTDEVSEALVACSFKPDAQAIVAAHECNDDLFAGVGG